MSSCCEDKSLDNSSGDLGGNLDLNNLTTNNLTVTQQATINNATITGTTLVNNITSTGLGLFNDITATGTVQLGNLNLDNIQCQTLEASSYTRVKNTSNDTLSLLMNSATDPNPRRGIIRSAATAFGIDMETQGSNKSIKIQSNNALLGTTNTLGPAYVSVGSDSSNSGAIDILANQALSLTSTTSEITQTAYTNMSLYGREALTFQSTLGTVNVNSLLTMNLTCGPSVTSALTGININSATNVMIGSLAGGIRLAAGLLVASVPNPGDVIIQASQTGGLGGLITLNALSTFPGIQPPNAISLTTDVGVIALTSGAGGVAVTTGLGVVAVSTGGGAIQLRTGIGAGALAAAILLETVIGGAITLKSGTDAINLLAGLGGVNAGTPTFPSGQFSVYTSDGVTSTANINMTTHTGGFGGAGNILLDATQGHTGNLVLYSKGSIQITSNNTYSGGGVSNSTGGIYLNTSASSTSGQLYDYRFPSGPGNAGQVLTSNGSGTAQSWTTVPAFNNGNLTVDSLTVTRQGETIRFTAFNLHPSGFATIYNGINFGATFIMDCNNYLTGSQSGPGSNQGGTFIIDDNPAASIFTWNARAANSATNNTVMTLSAASDLTVNGVIKTNSYTDATATNTGSLITLGGGSVSKNLHVGLNITANNSFLGFVSFIYPFQLPVQMTPTSPRHTTIFNDDVRTYNIILPDAMLIPMGAKFDISVADNFTTLNNIPVNIKKFNGDLLTTLPEGGQATFISQFNQAVNGDWGYAQYVPTSCSWGSKKMITSTTIQVNNTLAASSGVGSISTTGGVSITKNLFVEGVANVQLASSFTGSTQLLGLHQPSAANITNQQISLGVEPTLNNSAVLNFNYISAGNIVNYFGIGTTTALNIFRFYPGLGQFETKTINLNGSNNANQVLTVQNTVTTNSDLAVFQSPNMANFTETNMYLGKTLSLYNCGKISFNFTVTGAVNNSLRLSTYLGSNVLEIQGSLTFQKGPFYTKGVYYANWDQGVPNGDAAIVISPTLQGGQASMDFRTDLNATGRRWRIGQNVNGQGDDTFSFYNSTYNGNVGYMDSDARLWMRGGLVTPQIYSEDNLEIQASYSNSKKINIHCGSYQSGGIYLNTSDNAGNVNYGSTNIGNKNLNNSLFICANQEKYLGSISANGIVNISNTLQNNQFMTFYRGGENGAPLAAIGSIIENGFGGTSFLTTSDYRIKENVVDMPSTLLTINQLRPVTFSFKSDEKHYVNTGFIAHEVQEVFPEAVSGEKDAVDEYGNFKLQQLSLASFTPILTKAVQELHQLLLDQQLVITTLVERIALLEQK